MNNTYHKLPYSQTADWKVSGWRKFQRDITGMNCNHQWTRMDTKEQE